MSELPPPITVVGIGADGWPGLAGTSRAALREAEVVIGGPRQLALLPADEVAAARVPWPSPLRPAVPGLLAEHAGRRVAVLASGDPMFYGIGRTLAEALTGTPAGTPAQALTGTPAEDLADGLAGSAGSAGAERLRVLPHPSSVSYACARLGWPLETTEVVSLVGRPLDTLALALHPGRRLLVLSAGAATPAAVAALLTARGFGAARLRVLEQLGGPGERHLEGPADGWPHPAGDPLNVIAVELGPGPRTSLVPGLPDDAYESDGQLTKRHVRAATLATLAPAPGELLWDIGGGSGSIAIEWLRAHRENRAVTVERDPVRAARISRNAAALGVPRLDVVTGAAPAALGGLPVPDAVFIGGGLTAPGLLDACWAALPPGGRLVANTVTLESEALLTEWYRRHGGELLRLAVAHAVPVGGFTGWRQAMPVTQWSAVKPPAEAARPTSAAARPATAALVEQEPS
ncbi:precorrin-6Y C5,15-methyltransferase (decarboxylating) subunit CbiT [Kitasatospora sp. RG8]|uniref:precorrin-6Y C5,15-methyltransferase (decarboxylating) subunit CbiT n=1 Tax=Kitasatospora sp. RG8 TaxID=2820815 RepID=UPI001AE03CAF|nr:precorrin-6Y C5,15-methyltransferase (decarboxylating) subunit CbiT [Kitasatospora sp. RG8]MBP0448025.1 precorrin-6Y C5,15-methyltransferase (decarboxylating) subunit CbiT [Kitasatospora sp. RG8]